MATISCSPPTLIGVVLAPLTLTLGAVFAYNVAETLGLALSALAGFVMVRRYVQATDGIGTIAALIGGALYGFSPYMAAHALGHPPLVTVFTPPLMLLVVDDLFVRQGRRATRYGVALGLLAAVQLLLWEELLLVEALIGAIGLKVLLTLTVAARPSVPLSTIIEQRWRYAARGLAAVLITLALLAGGPLAIQFFGPRAVHGAAWPPNQFVIDLLAFFTPTPLQALAPRFATELTPHFRATIYEWSGYLGIPLIALLGYATVSLWGKRQPALPASAIARLSRPALLGSIFAVIWLLVALLSMGPLINVAGRTSPLPVALIALAIAFGVRWRIADKGVRRAPRALLGAVF